MAAPATAQQTIPPQVSYFFETLYQKSPILTMEKKNRVYWVSGEGVSILADPYGGFHIEVNIELTPAQYQAAQTAIQEIASAFQRSKEFDSIWIDISLPARATTLGLIVPPSFIIGTPGQCDLVYDYQTKKMRVWSWLNADKECAIPAGATHNIGATALIIDQEAQKVLLVVNTRRNESWNLPGGSFDPLQDKAPCFTALREAEEEGGFQIDNKDALKPKLVGEMQFPFNQFAPAINQIWAYFIDGISEKPLNPPPAEIERAEWIPFREVAASEDKLRELKISEEIKAPLLAAIHGRGFEEIANKKWMIVHAPKV